MAYKEYKSRSFSQQPFHLRVWDSFRELHERFRIGWLLATIVVLITIFCYALLSAREQYHEDNAFSFPASAMREYPRVATGEDLRECAKEGNENGYCMAVTQIAGIDAPIFVLADYPEPTRREISDSQEAAFTHIQENYPNIYQRSLPAMLVAYRNERESFLNHSQEVSGEKTETILRVLGYPSIEEMMPDIQTADTLDSRLGEPTIHISPVESEGYAFLAISFTPDWTVNSFGFIMHRDSVVWCGSYPEYRIDSILSNNETPDEPAQ